MSGHKFSSRSVLKWLAIGVGLILIYELVKQLQNTSQSVANAVSNALAATISDLGSILSAPFAALAASPAQAGSAIGSGIASGLGAVANAVKSGFAGFASATNIFSFLWDWILSVASAIVGLPFAILGIQAPIGFGVTTNTTPPITPSNTAPTSALSTSFLTEWMLAPLGGSSTNNPPAVTTPDPTVAPVPQSGANTISNGSSATSSGNFSVMLPGGAGSGTGGSGYQ